MGTHTDFASPDSDGTAVKPKFGQQAVAYLLRTRRSYLLYTAEAAQVG